MTTFPDSWKLFTCIKGVFDIIAHQHLLGTIRLKRQQSVKSLWLAFFYWLETWSWTWPRSQAKSLTITHLRAADCKNQEWEDKSDFMDFFIFCPEKPFSELLSKITIKLSKEFSFAKREMSCSGTTRHWILSRNYTSLTLSWRKMLYRIIMNFYNWSVGNLTNP